LVVYGGAEVDHSVIKIAGAGIAGLTTAIGLAREGRPVEIYEAFPDSGWERKDTWDAVENWTTEADFVNLLARWQISLDFIIRPVNQFEIYNPIGECHIINADRPILYLARRGNQPGALEYSLKNQALQNGVAIHYNQRISFQDVDVWAVGAQHRGQFLAAGVKFQTRQPDTVKLLIRTNHAPKAYAYLFIQDGQGVLSVILTRDFKNARSYLERCIDFFKKISLLNMENLRMTSGFGGFKRNFWLNNARPLRVGEAGGFQDYLWGFGIRFAIQSGFLASKSLNQGSDYIKSIKNEIHPKVYSSLLNRAAYNRAGDHVYQMLIERFSKTPNIQVLLRRYYSISIPNQLHWLFQEI